MTPHERDTAFADLIHRVETDRAASKAESIAVARTTQPTMTEEQLDASFEAMAFQFGC